MISLILILIGFIIYAILEGKRDGVLETSRAQEVNRINLHPLFAIERLMIGTLIWAYVDTFKSSLVAIIYTVALGLIFSWFHNGAYYQKRRQLNPLIYKRGWTDTSTTSKAIFELNFIERTILLIIGTTLITICL